MTQRKRTGENASAVEAKRARTSDDPSTHGGESQIDTLSSGSHQETATDRDSTGSTTHANIGVTVPVAPEGSFLSPGDLASSPSLTVAAPATVTATDTPLLDVSTSPASVHVNPDATAFSSSSNEQTASALDVLSAGAPRLSIGEVANQHSVANNASDSVLSDHVDRASPSSHPAVTTSSPSRSTVTSAPNSGVNTLIDPVQIREYPAEVQQRITMLVSFENTGKNSYAISKIPRNATWGSIAGTVPNADKLLCNPNTGTPISVLCVGRVLSSTFVSQGSPVPLATIVLVPPSRAISIQAVRLTSGLSNPPFTMPSPNDWHPVRISRWQQRRLPDGERDPPVLFDEVYDGRDGVRTRSAMSKISPLDLHARDVVLVESRVIKYNTKEPNGRWVTRAQYEFSAIVLMYSAPTADDADETRVDDEHDVFGVLGA